MVHFGIFRVVSLLMECSHIALLTLTVMVMRGLVFISGSYSVCLCVRA